MKRLCQSLLTLVLGFLMVSPAFSDDSPIYVVRPQSAIGKAGAILPNDAFGTAPVVVPSTPSVTYTSLNYESADWSGVAVVAKTVSPDNNGKRHVVIPMAGYTTQGTQLFPMAHSAMCGAGADPAYNLQWDYFSTIASDQGRLAIVNIQKPGTYKLVLTCWFDDGYANGAYQWREAKVRLNLSVD